MSSTKVKVYSELPVKRAERRVEELRARLAERTEAKKISALLDPLFLSFPAHNTPELEGAAKEDNHARRLKIYFLACKDLPPWALHQTVADVLAGKTDWHDGRFLPTPAQIAKHARGFVDRTARQELIEAYQRLKEERQRAEWAVEEAKKPKTPEEWEQRRKRADQLVKRVLGGLEAKT